LEVEMNIRTLGLPVLVVVVMLIAGPAGATVVINSTASSDAASNTDLLQTALDTADYAGTWDYENRQGANQVPNAVTDGVAGSQRQDYGSGSVIAAAMADSSRSDAGVVTYTLDTTAVTEGYNITQIDFYHGWVDGGRDAFSFKIEYQTVAGGTAWNEYYNSDAMFAFPDVYYGLTSFTDDSGSIASGVSAVRFSFPQIENGYGGISEIDVIPEPATLALLTLGGLAIARRRRRDA
jgi:PEP-CTERM motif-containing protein